jgi:hypothetical protein
MILRENDMKIDASLWLHQWMQVTLPADKLDRSWNPKVNYHRKDTNVVE